jgi:hypothetical protein
MPGLDLWNDFKDIWYGMLQGMVAHCTSANTCVATSCMYIISTNISDDTLWYLTVSSREA